MKKAGILSLFLALFTVFPAIIAFAQDLQQGNATWYPDNSLDLYASHARFPPGTRLQVTNLKNQKEVYVTVMGRIQNSDNRILDVSQAAAQLIDMNERGYTPIRLVVMRGLAPTPAPAPAPKTAANTKNNAPAPKKEPVPRNEPVPVPEVTAVPVSQNYEEDEEYENDYSNDNSSDYSSDYSNDYEDDYEDEPSQDEDFADETPPPVRTFPQQTAQQIPGHVLLRQIVVLINGKEEIIDVPDGVYMPYPPGQQAPSQNIYPSYPPPPTPPTPPPPKRVYIQAPPPSYPAPVQSPPPSYPAPVQPPNPVIRVIPNLPDPHSGKVYRMQVGAFSQVPLAQACFEKLRAAGLSPAYEQNGSLYRVVLSGIRAADVYYTAQRLGAAGFTEAWIREESRY